MIIIGVDPSTVRLGYGVLRHRPGRQHGDLEYVTAGVITAPAGRPLVRRLDELATGLEEVVNEIGSDEAVLCGIEAGFGNPKSGIMGALSLGAARGVAALVMYRRFHEEVKEYFPSTVKKAATGNGAAQKDQVARVVALRLGLRVVPEPDAGDALAVAIARAQDSDLVFRGVCQPDQGLST